MEGLYSSKSSVDSPFSLLCVSRSLALIDRLKPAEHLTIKWKELKSASAKVEVGTSADLPTFLGTEAQHFRAFGTFGALGSPMGAQPQVSVSLFVRRRF